MPVDDEDKGVAKHDTLGGTQDMTIISESGLYSLTLSSKLPSAKQFQCVEGFHFLWVEIKLYG